MDKESFPWVSLVWVVVLAAFAAINIFYIVNGSGWLSWIALFLSSLGAVMWGGDIVRWASRLK